MFKTKLTIGVIIVATHNYAYTITVGKRVIRRKMTLSTWPMLQHCLSQKDVIETVLTDIDTGNTCMNYDDLSLAISTATNKLRDDMIKLQHKHNPFGVTPFEDISEDRCWNSIIKCIMWETFGDRQEDSITYSARMFVYHMHNDMVLAFIISG